MAKDTRVTFDSTTSNNNNGGNNNNNGAMSPNGIGGSGPGGGGGGGGGGGNGLGGFAPHHTHLLPPQPSLHSHHHTHHPGKLKRHSRLTERQVSTEDAENCINEISESFPALSTKAHRLMRQVSGSFNSRTLRVSLSLSIMFNILMGITSGIFFGMWMSTRNNNSRDEIAATADGAAAPGSAAAFSDNHIYHHQGVLLDPTGNDLFGSITNNGKGGLSPAQLAAFRSTLLSNPDLMESTCAWCPSRCPTGGVNPNQGAGLQPSRNDNPFYPVRQDYVVVDSCVRCSQVGNRQVRVRSGDGMCCVNTKPLPIPDPQPECPCKGEPPTDYKSLSAAHMMLNVHRTKTTKSFHWMTEDPDNICYIGEGLRYSNGQVTVLTAGSYHIYSQVTFSTIDNPLPEGKNDMLIVFSIQRLTHTAGSKPRTQTLMLSKLTMEANKEENASVAGNIHLKANDILNVYISHPSFLKNLLHANFFGIYKL